MFFKTEKHYIFNQGNIGIGVSILPTEKLEVNGKIKTTGFQLNDGQQSEGKFLRSDVNGNAEWAVLPESAWTTNGINVYRIEGNTGLGTENPEAKLHVAGGDIYVQDISHGIIMKSPDGNCWRGTIDNSGMLIFATINCPDENQYITEPLNNPENFKIYPNPVQDELKIDVVVPTVETYSVVLIASNGKEIIRQERLNSSTTVSLIGIPSGSYLLKIICMGEENIWKIQKQ